MKVILLFVVSIIQSSLAFPGGCDFSRVSSKEWRPMVNPLDAQKLVFPNRGLSTRPSFLRSIWPQRKFTKMENSHHQNSFLPINEDSMCGAENRGQRIVGGQETQEHQFPWMVGTEVDGFIFCGASLINAKWVLTAAHCAENAIYVNLYLGAHRIFSGSNEEGRLEICAENTITHPQFDFPNYDITLVEIPVPVSFSQTISPVCLPPPTDIGNEYLGEELTAIGWGYTNHAIPFPEDALHFVDQLPVMPDAECRSLFENADLGETFFCVDSVFNGKPGHGTCNGDSGGPLVRKNANDKWEQAGIVSFGSTNCEEGAPDGFTQVNLLLEWIESNTGRH